MELTSESKYRLLAQISHEIRDTLDLEEILNRLLDLAFPVLPYDAAGIFVLDRDVSGRPDDLKQALIAGLVMRGFDMQPIEPHPLVVAGKGIIGHVIKTGETVVAPDVDLDERYIQGRSLTRSEIAVPLMRNDRTIGALNLESDTLGTFDEGDEEVLRFFADAAVISIEKAMLHRRILEQKRIEEQLELARQIQSRLLPGDPPRIEGYELAGICIPAFEIGGDYYDYFNLPGGGTAIAIADVAGKGIPGGLIMTAFRALLRTNARLCREPARVVESLYRLLPDFTGERHFVTAVYGVLDPGSGRFSYANCGHPAPLHLKADGSMVKLTPTGPLLSGALEGISWEQRETMLGRGDLLLLYTDGVVDMTRADGDSFGAERLEGAARVSAGPIAGTVIERIRRVTREFSGSDRFPDDFTLVVICRP